MRSRIAEPNPELNNSAYSRGCKSYEAGRLREAIAHFREAFEADPEDADCLFAIGNCYLDLHKFKRAESAYREALLMADETSQPNILYNLGNALYDQARFAEAIEMYARIPSGLRVWQSGQRNTRLAREKMRELESD